MNIFFFPAEAQRKHKGITAARETSISVLYFFFFLLAHDQDYNRSVNIYFFESLTCLGKSLASKRNEDKGVISL